MGRFGGGPRLLVKFVDEVVAQTTVEAVTETAGEPSAVECLLTERLADEAVVARRVERGRRDLDVEDPPGPGPFVRGLRSVRGARLLRSARLFGAA
ncbi:hypothetical protein LUW77_15345 [Streptomyces radiopugnans]|nr:hypothetical protein LUW77_15345 [Streptomyces radiopugnans]